LERNEAADKANQLRDEAASAVIKLDEARILLNKLLGPQGPLSQSERHKFLPNKGQGEYEIGPTGDAY